MQCPLSITQAAAERFQTRYKMCLVLPSTVCLHTKHYTSIIHQSQSNVNEAHYQNMATTVTLGLTLCYGYDVGNGFGNFLGFLRLHSWCSPPVFCHLPGYEWLNWEVIDAGCQVALEECHWNASC